MAGTDVCCSPVGRCPCPWEKIKFFQDIYERYSSIDLSFVSDRPVDIRGLEARLIGTFGMAGGFGIIWGSGRTAI
jgi:hypothetical protein